MSPVFIRGKGLSAPLFGVPRILFVSDKLWLGESNVKGVIGWGKKIPLDLDSKYLIEFLGNHPNTLGCFPRKLCWATSQ